jgi:hypothetical protein
LDRIWSPLIASERFSTIYLSKQLDEHSRDIFDSAVHSKQVAQVPLQVFKPCATRPTQAAVGTVIETMALGFEHGDATYTGSPASSPSGFKIHS